MNFQQVTSGDADGPPSLKTTDINHRNEMVEEKRDLEITWLNLLVSKVSKLKPRDTEKVIDSGQ